MNRFIRQRGKQKKEFGFALIAAIIFVVLIGLLGVVASFLFVSGTTTTKDYVLSTRAFYAAEGGLVRGIRQCLLAVANGTAYTNETINVTLGSQTIPVVITVSGTNPRQITSSCTFQNVQRVVQQNVQWSQSIFSQYALSSQGNIVMGGTTYSSCPGGTGCPANSITNQYLLPITVSGGSNQTISSTTTLSSGTYNYNTLTINNTLNVSSSGVTINCKQLTVGNSVNINSGSGSDGNNLLIVVEGNVTIGNGVTFKGAIFAPNGSIAIGTSLTMNGAIAGNSVSIGTPSNITFDNGAGQHTPAGYNKTASIAKVANSWQEVF
jgi:Tfp pilus assembly protein PilX